MSAPSTCVSRSGMPASATPTSTRCAVTGARSPTRRSSVTRSPARSSRSAPRSPATSVGDRVGVGCMVNSCRKCENCVAGFQQYCLEGNIQTYNGVDVDGTNTQGGYSTEIVVVEDFVLKLPGSDSVRSRRAAAVRRHHDLLASRALEGRTRQDASRSSASAGSGTWRSSSPTPWVPRSRCCPRRCRRRKTGCSLGADHFFATSDRGDLQGTRQSVRPHHQHRERRPRHQRLPAVAAPRRHPGQRRRAAREAGRASLHPLRQPSLVRRARASAASTRRSGCSTSAPSTASPATSR